MGHTLGGADPMIVEHRIEVLVCLRSCSISASFPMRDTSREALSQWLVKDQMYTKSTDLVEKSNIVMCPNNARKLGVSDHILQLAIILQRSLSIYRSERD